MAHHQMRDPAKRIRSPGLRAVLQLTEPFCVDEAVAATEAVGSPLKRRTLSEKLAEMVKTGVLRRVGVGLYQVNENQ